MQTHPAMNSYIGLKQVSSSHGHVYSLSWYNGVNTEKKKQQLKIP